MCLEEKETSGYNTLEELIARHFPELLEEEIRSEEDGKNNQ